MSVKRRSISPGNEIHMKKPCAGCDLIGQLTARSHILNSSPGCILFEICTKESVQYIICEQLQCVLSGDKLDIGYHYKFSNLLPSALKLKTGAVKCFKFSEKTTWCEVEDQIETYQPPCYRDLITIRGKVTEVNCHLGVCTLNNSVTVVISTCARIALLTMPKEGQRVTIFNVHRINLENGNVAYIMCVKSYLSLEGEHSSQIPPLNLSSLLLTLGDAIRDYRLILWLQDCSASILKSFSDEFLSANGIPVCDYDDFRLNLLESIVKFVLQKINVPKKSFVEEFFASEHSLHCGSLKNEMLHVSLINLLDFDKENPALEDEQGEDGLNVYWQYDVKRNSEKILIGVVTVKNVSHRLTFNDAFGSVACLILPKDGQILEGKDLARINRNIVLISEYDVAREKFSWRDNEESTQELSHKVRCLAVHVDKMHVISSFAKDWRSPNCTGVHLISTPEANRDSPINNSFKHSRDGHSKCNGSSNSKQVNGKRGTFPESARISPLKGSPLGKYMSQYIYVQTKTTPFAPKQGRPARCYILVSLLGEMVPSTSPRNAPSQRGSNASPIFIGLEGSLLGVHPVISVNTAYEIRFPIQFDKSFFAKGCPLSSVVGMKKMLPTVMCVTLPSCSEIHLVSNCHVPSESLKFRDCYGIDQSLLEANTNELINIKGYIVSRYHQEPRFEREKINVKANGFGVPGSKIIALILRDTPPESQSGTPATIYLSYWPTLQYPIALVPGGKVVFRFVHKVIPKIGTKGSAYFRASILSSVDILELPKSENCDDDQGRKTLLGPRSILFDIVSENAVGCKWMTVSMAHLKKVSFSASCSTCKHPYQNGACSFVGCAAPPNASIFSQACFRVSEFGSSAVVFVASELVKKIFLGSEKLWEMISVLTHSCGQLEYTPLHKDVSQLSLEQRVFRSLCKSLLYGERFHMLCRPFNSKKDSDKSSALPVLYAVDISPVTLHAAVS